MTEGTPLIILHGLFGSLDNWATVARSLGESFPVITIDLRNHGRSPHHDEFNYDVMADDLFGFMGQQGLSKMNLLGHSMGGKTAMNFAMKYPDAIERLVVVDIAPKKYPPVHETIFEALMSVDPANYSERHEIDTALSKSITDVPIRKWLLKNIGRTEHGKLFWKMNLPAIHRNYYLLSEAVSPGANYNGQVLFIKGGKSDHIAVEDESAIFGFFPRASIETIPGAGHWVHADAPDKLVALVKNFLLHHQR